MNGTASTTGSAAIENLAVFEVGGQAYALDVAQVREIVRFQEITPLPKAPSLIEGVIELRGSVIPVIDLGLTLNGQPIERHDQERIAVLETDGLVLGLCVDAATEVLTVEASALEDPPILATHAGYDAVRAVVRRPEAKPVLVLCLEHILESIYRSALPSEGARGE